MCVLVYSDVKGKQGPLIYHVCISGCFFHQKYFPMFANVNSVQENKKKTQIIIKTNRLQLDYKAKEKDEF